MTTRGFWAMTAERLSSGAVKNSSPSFGLIHVTGLLDRHPCLTVTLIVIGRIRSSLS
jgi:hypothetical protein